MLITKRSFLLVLFVILTMQVFSQDTILVNEPDSSLRYYCANTKVVIDTGFSFYATDTTRLHAYVSEMCAVAYPETPYSKGSIRLGPDYGTAPYYYFWTDSSRAGYREGLSSGIYEVVVVDTTGDSTALTIPVGMQLQWDSITGCAVEYDALRKTGSNGWGSGRATLNNLANTSGEIQVEVGDLSSKWTYGYRLSTNNQADEYADMDFAFYIDDNDKLYSYENSTLTYLALVSIGDILSIKFSGDQVIFYQNGSNLRQTTYNPANNYKIDFSMYSSGMKMGKTTAIAYPFWSDITAAITHLDCYNSETGSITITHNSGPTPTSYSWTGPNSFSSSSQSITNLEPGDYYLSVAYGNSGFSKVYSVGYNVNWKNKVDALDNGSELIDDGSSGYNNSGASSINILPISEAGWIRFKVTLDGSSNNLAVGFADVFDGDQNYPDIDYGLKFETVYLSYPVSAYLKLVYVIESGTQATGVSFFDDTDEFEIRYDGTDITYYRNNHSVAWISGPNYYSGYISQSVTSQKMMVDAALAINGEGISEASTSFPCPPQGYPILKKRLDAGFYVSLGDQVLFQYLEEYSSSTVPASRSMNYRILNVSMDDVTGTLPTKYISKIGANYYTVDLSGVTLTAGDYYILEATNDKNEKFLMRFLYQ